MQGEEGATGSIGTRGGQGPDGIQGVQGEEGAIGERGTRGQIGPQGLAGLQGDTGAYGVVGSTGELVPIIPTTASTTGYIVGKSNRTQGWNSTFYISQAYFIDNELYEGSDERAKTFVEDVPVDLEKLSLLPKKYFYWKKGYGNVLKKTIGTSAQELEKLYPEIVNEDENGFKSVSYEKLSIIALAAIDKLNEKIKSLEEKIEKNG